jgi:hypothetical protein
MDLGWVNGEGSVKHVNVGGEWVVQQFLGGTGLYTYYAHIGIVLKVHY